jgi:TPR repeat protein
MEIEQMNATRLMTRSAIRHAVLTTALLLTGAIAADACASAGTEVARRAYDKGNYAEALKQLQPLAEAGDTSAQVLLGRMLADGKGVPQDDAQAAQWYWKAATAGDTQAQTLLSAAYTDGKGVNISQVMADYWQWKAATNQAAEDKTRLAAEVGKLSDASKTSNPVIDITKCKAPDYRHTGYGYHHSETMQMLFLVDEQGRIMEVSLLEKTNWSTLDHDFLVSYSKTCAFKPALKDGKAVDGLYKMAVTWTVDP